MAIWFDEVFEDKLRFGAKIKRVLFNEQSPYQKVTIVETEALGKALLIDDLWMCAEGDEIVYHEMISHSAITTAPRSERILIIGGGDGGTAREVLSYPHVKHVDMVEIDGVVVDACKTYLREIGTAWEDPRLNVHITDGIEWVKRTDLEPYDVIIIDGSDPVGPAVGLFNESFYRDCNNRLAEHGVLVTQAESPKLFFDIHIELNQTLRRIFPVVKPYYHSIMIYAGGLWAWIYASKGQLPQDFNEELMRFAEKRTDYFNRQIHLGGYAVPNRILRALGDLKDED